MKNRQYLFIVGCLLALIVCYKFAISNTLLLYSEYKIIANSNPTIEKQESTHILSELNKLNMNKLYYFVLFFSIIDQIPPTNVMVAPINS